MNILVSVLSSGSLGTNWRSVEQVTIEDNVGESIHIHFMNFRIDLTVDGFLGLADSVAASLKKLDEIHGHR